MCDIWKRKDGSALHASELERHRESILRLSVEHVVLTGGEPLLNRELDAICQFFRDLKIRITLLTTGLLLAKKYESVADLFDDVIISIDGPQVIHDQIRRVPGAFAAIEKGTEAIRHRNPMLPITCRTTVQKLNHAHLRDTVSAAKVLGLNSISFLAADLSSGAFNREQRWSGDRQNEIALTHNELNALRDEIELLITHCHEEIRTGFVVEGDAKLRRLAHRFEEYLDGTPPKAPLCNAPWVSTVVEVNGDVRPCFFHESIGNINLLTLEEIINSTAGLNFRDKLDVATNETCKRCVCSLNYRQ
jgi:Fe-coproporphyrin III synthase